MKPTFSISVRNLVEFVLRSGDLRSDFLSSVTAVEGIRAHQRIQRERPDDYQVEVPVRYVMEHADFQLTISGRIDVVFHEPDEALVEEIKTTRRDLAQIEASSSELHWGQAQSYAYLYALQEALPNVVVQLTYVHLDSGRTLELTRPLSFDQLEAFFNGLLERYLQWVRRLTHWAQVRDDSLDRLEFPFADYRAGQRDMAVAVFRTIRDGHQLFVQAATGIGKTMASVYPALKALGRHQVPKVVFLTARTTGRLAAEDALQTLGGNGMRLKWVSLTAKEKICFTGTKECTPEACAFARGHYDRLNEALAAAFEYDALDRDTIEALAWLHQVCPFEFSLELITWADCVIGDYNYAFDPFVTLKRLFGEEAGGHAVLVDEAHNLVDRSREMFSASLLKRPFIELKRLVKIDLPHLSKVLGRLNSWMAALRRRCLESDGYLVEKEPPDGFLERLVVFLRLAEKWLQKNLQADYRDQLLQLYFECRRFMRVAEMYSASYTTIAQAEGRDVRIKLFCINPADQLKQCWQQCKAGILFSATLTPPDYFRTLLGCSDGAQRIDLPSPFPRQNLMVFEASRISTLYKQRDATCHQVTRAIANLVSRHKGNYLLFFPSYVYLSMVHDHFCQHHPGIETIVQTTEMNESQREAFLARFTDEVPHTLVGFVVMGGIFGEGIDLKGRRLSGAAIVGVGLPGIDPERELIRDYYDRQYRSGFEFAYQFPGINRVLQAVGRVIRSETDRGVVLLIDQRYAQYRYRMLLPKSWHIQPVGSDADFTHQLVSFWEQAGQSC